jgi:hypothetical protein
VTRFLNGPVIAMFLAAACALTAYVFAVGAPRAAPPGSRVAVAGADAPAGADGVGAPSRVEAVRLDRRPARHHRPVRWAVFVAEKQQAARLGQQLRAARHRIRQLERARHVQAHVETVGWPWVAIADCESGDGDGRPPYSATWGYDGPSGFDGGVQFDPGTWSAYRRGDEPAHAYEASPATQVAVAERVLAAQGWGAWPVCSVKVGLR